MENKIIRIKYIHMYKWNGWRRCARRQFSYIFDFEIFRPKDSSHACAAGKNFFKVGRGPQKELVCSMTVSRADLERAWTTPAKRECFRLMVPEVMLVVLEAMAGGMGSENPLTTSMTLPERSDRRRWLRQRCEGGHQGQAAPCEVTGRS